MKVAVKRPTALNATASVSTVSVTKNFTVKGQLTSLGTPLGWMSITLQRSTDNKTFIDLRSKQANATGWYSFSWNETKAGTYYYRTTYAGSATYLNATSNGVKVVVS